MSAHIIDFAELQQLSGKRQPCAVERWAKSQGIRTFRSRQGVYTTPEALNAALGLAQGPAANDQPDTLDPDLVA